MKEAEEFDSALEAIVEIMNTECNNIADVFEFVRRKRGYFSHTKRWHAVNAYALILIERYWNDENK